MSKVYLFPIGVFLVCQTTFMCTSLAAYLQEHVKDGNVTAWRLPYISEGGTTPPESCIFGQFINIGCLLLGIVIYIRYHQIEHIIDSHSDLIYLTKGLNRRASWLGGAASLGFSIVANFQLTNVPAAHYTGAFACFGLGTAYFWLQAYVTYYARPKFGSMRMAFLRFLMAALCTYFFFVTIITSCSVYGAIFDSKNDGCGQLKTSVSGEWVVATIFNLYMLSFTIDFKSICFTHPTICLDKDNTGTRVSETRRMSSSLVISNGIDNYAFTQSTELHFIENHV